MSNPRELFVPHLQDLTQPKSDKRGTKSDSFRATVMCLALDYDGTLSPIDASRKDSQIAGPKLTVLKEIGKKIPIIVVTRKDLRFIVPRTPFACAWSAVGGLETRIGDWTQTTDLPESKVKDIANAVIYAKSHLGHSRIEIEQKIATDGSLLAFCVDWRHTQRTKEMLSKVNEIADYCRTLELEVVRSIQPFFEVYPQLPDKGKALKEIVGRLGVEDGIMYLGDSEADNPGFLFSDISLGVIHGENDPNGLACDYLVGYEDVEHLFDLFATNHFLFDSDYFIIQNKDKYMKTTLRNHEKGSGGDA